MVFITVFLAFMCGVLLGTLIWNRQNQHPEVWEEANEQAERAQRRMDKQFDNFLSYTGDKQAESLDE